MIYSPRQSYRNGILLYSRADEDQSWRRRKGESFCCRMQQVFSPLCVVSARITRRRRGEERRRGRRMARESGCATSAAFRLTFPCSWMKTGQWALLGTGLL